MAGRRRRPRSQGAPAFRPSAPTSAGRAPTRNQTLALLCVLVLVATGIALASYLVKPTKARSFTLFYGSMYINDDTSPVAVDLASGKPTVRVTNAYTAVAATRGQDVDVYPLAGGNTLLLDPKTGEFNMVDSTGFVVKTSDGGVPLPAGDPSSTSTAVASGSSAYIVRRNAASTSVYLVGAATVSAAIGSTKGAKARAYATMHSPLSNDPAPAAGADGGLWLLTQAGGRGRAITQLTVPPGSNPGVTLTPTPHGTVSGPAAVGTATRNFDGTGGDVPAVASAAAIAVFRNGVRTNVPVAVGAGVDRILPASNAHGIIDFLYHSNTGWSQVTVPAATGTTARVRPLGAIPSDAQLAAPAQSAGNTYTMDTAGNGALWQIDASGTAAPVPGAATYPLKPAEQPQFGGAQVLADGTRVIFNCRANLRAEVVFSDGSQPPRSIDKHAAVQVDPSGATVLTDAHSTGPTKPDKTHKPPKTVRRPTQTINDKINCKVANQIPRVPTLIAGDRAARSIGLTWVYTRLDPTDCYPSTFVVDIKVLTSDAPSPLHGQVRVQGQDGVTVTGLFPATEYELTVTAYINLQHTTSAPIRVTTGPEGPAAPTDVRATTDSSGNWTVSWNSCGGIAQGCVPSASWNIIPSFCDGRGLSDVPAKVSVAGDPTQHSFTHVYEGSDALLGRGMCFAVQGVGTEGTIGTTSAPSAPAYSWTTPDAAGLTLTASQPASTSFGGTTTTTVDLGLGSDPVRTVGGVGATITLRLSGPDAPQSKTIVWDGRLDRVDTTFTGIRAGAQYSATATVAAPRHSSATATKGPVTVTTRANWPTITAAASCPNGGGAVVLSCTLTVQLSGPASATANGERFDLTDSQLLCGGGNSSLGLSKSGFDPAHDAITQQVDLLQYNGSCTVNVHLVESGAVGSGPEVFGGTTSPLISQTVDLGHASTLDAGQGDFSAAWDKHDGSSALVRYTGGHSDGDLDQITQNWQENLVAPNGASCGSSGQTPTHSGIFVDVNPASCVNDFGSQTGWQVTVSYVDKGTSNQHSFTYTLDGTPPGYIPCTVSASNFSAAWSGTGDQPSVDVTFTPDSNSDLDGCANWQYTVVNTTQQSCGSNEPDGGRPDHGNNVTTVPVNCDTTISTLWHVRIDYAGPEGQRNPLIVQIDGTPPTPTPTPTPTSPTPTDTSTSP